MQKLESLQKTKFKTLEKSQMRQVIGGYAMPVPDECTGGGSSTNTYQTPSGPQTVTRTWSADCLNVGGEEGSNIYYNASSPQDSPTAPKC